MKGAGRKDEEWFDPEEPHDLSNFAAWGQKEDNMPSRLELELFSRLSGHIIV